MLKFQKFVKCHLFLFVFTFDHDGPCLFTRIVPIPIIATLLLQRFIHIHHLYSNMAEIFRRRGNVRRQVTIVHHHELVRGLGVQLQVIVQTDVFFGSYAGGGEVDSRTLKISF